MKPTSSEKEGGENQPMERAETYLFWLSIFYSLSAVFFLLVFYFTDLPFTNPHAMYGEGSWIALFSVSGLLLGAVLLREWSDVNPAITRSGWIIIVSGLIVAIATILEYLIL